MAWVASTGAASPGGVAPDAGGDPPHGGVGEVVGPPATGDEPARGVAGARAAPAAAAAASPSRPGPRTPCCRRGPLRGPGRVVGLRPTPPRKPLTRVLIVCNRGSGAGPTRARARRFSSPPRTVHTNSAYKRGIRHRRTPSGALLPDGTAGPGSARTRLRSSSRRQRPRRPRRVRRALGTAGRAGRLRHGLPDRLRRDRLVARATRRRCLLSAAEMADQARRFVDAVDVPVIVDADTGYGNAVERCTDRADLGAGRGGGAALRTRSRPRSAGTWRARRS